MFPYLRGAVSGAVDQTASGNSYNYCNTLLLHWCTWAFSGWRGSIRWKFLPRGAHSASFMPTLYVQRHPRGEIEFSRSSSGAPTYSDPKAASRAVIPTNPNGSIPASNQPFMGAKGQVYQSGYLNPAIEFECPYYSPFRFTPGKEEDHTGVNLFNEGFDYFIQGRGDLTASWDIHIATGEDFQLYFFTGLPRLYYEPAPPA